MSRQATISVEAPVAHQETTTARGPRLGEWVIAAFMLGLFTFGYLAAQDWPFRAALFPQMVASLGALLSALRLLGLAVETVRGRRPSVPNPSVAPAPAAAVGTQVATDAPGPAAAEADDAASRVTLVDEEAEEDSSMEYAFATAGGRAWLAALLWIVAFFVAFFVLGVFVAVPVFALVYLRVAGKASWVGALLYAIVTGAFIYLLFRQVLYLPLPTGVIPFLQL